MYVQTIKILETILWIKMWNPYDKKNVASPEMTQINHFVTLFVVDIK